MTFSSLALSGFSCFPKASSAACTFCLTCRLHQTNKVRNSWHAGLAAPIWLGTHIYILSTAALECSRLFSNNSFWLQSAYIMDHGHESVKPCKSAHGRADASSNMSEWQEFESVAILGVKCMPAERARSMLSSMSSLDCSRFRHKC